MVDEIQEVHALNLLDGVITNPTDVSKATAAAVSDASSSSLNPALERAK